jgi:hypothetical protein
MLALLIMLAALSPAASEARDAGIPLTWTTEQIPGTDLGSPRDPSLAFHPQGYPYVAYFDDALNNLVLTHKQGGEWVSDTVDQVDGRVPVLKFDSQGRPAIAYHYRLTAMRYAFWSGSAWVLENIGSGGVGDFLSFALDANDVPHVVFRDPDNDRLWYSRRGPGGWINEPIVEGTSGTRDCAIAVDAAGNPHIMYVQNSPFMMRYATKAGGVWSYESVDSTGTPTLSASSIRIDAAGVPQVAYQEGAAGELAFASRTGGVWSSAVVDPNIGPLTTGYYPSLDLDSGDDPHIAQVRQSEDEVWYTVRNGTTWSSELVTASFTGCVETVIAIDPFENPVIVFRAQGSGDLIYSYGALNTDVASGATRGLSFSAGPNPALQGRTTFEFVVPPGAGGARVRVIDLAGRQVRVLAAGSVAGARRLEWDGRASDGVPAPPGIYAARLEIDGQPVASLRVAVLR